MLFGAQHISTDSTGRCTGAGPLDELMLLRAHKNRAWHDTVCHNERTSQQLRIGIISPLHTDTTISITA